MRVVTSVASSGRPFMKPAESWGAKRFPSVVVKSPADLGAALAVSCLQTNCDSMSDSRTSSGQPSALLAT